MIDTRKYIAPRSSARVYHNSQCPYVLGAHITGERYVETDDVSGRRPCKTCGG